MLKYLDRGAWDIWRRSTGSLDCDIFLHPDSYRREEDVELHVLTEYQLRSLLNKARMKSGRHSVVTLNYKYTVNDLIAQSKGMA